MHDLAHLPGVRSVEPFRTVPVRLRRGPHVRRLAILGLEPAPRLFRPIDAEGRLVPLPDDGLVLSRKLAEVLGAHLGDRVTVHVLEGEQPTREVVLCALVDDFNEGMGFMNRHALHRLLREGPALSGAYLAVDPRETEKLYLTLKKTPKVAGVSLKLAALASFQKTLDQNLLLMRAFNVAFASIIAFGVVYNSARIALAERSHELATLRVLGFTRGEISAILLGEMAVLTLVAIPLGLWLGYGFAAVACQAMESELQRIPLIIQSGTYAFAVVVILAASLVSALVVRRRLDHLDLVAVLKARE
jgi:putative ABC transport system permease protein